MHHLIYLSQATVPFSDAQLQDLLAQARVLNTQHDLTGLLLYGNGQFMQVLEGEEAAVRTTYDRISRDERHRDLMLYADKAIAQRTFPEWSMAYQALTPEQAAELPGYVAPAHLRLERPGMGLADTQLLQLLRSFVLPE